MKPTKILSLIVAAASSAIGSYLLIRLAVGAGFTVPVSGLNLIITLPVIGALVLLMALPILRYRRALREISKAESANSAANTQRAKRVDPFYAVRVLMLAKATAIAGSLFSGWHLGAIAVQVSAPVIPDTVWFNFAGFVGSVLMATAGIITERICKIPNAGANGNGTVGDSKSATEATPA